MLSKLKYAILMAIVLLVAVAPSFALEITIGGTLSEFGNPADEYSIYVEAGEQISVRLNCVGGTLDPYLRVFGPGGFYKENDDDGSDYWICNSGGSQYSSGLQFRAPSSGIYTIVATSYAIMNPSADMTDANGSYALDISGNFTPLFSYNADGRLNHGFGDLHAVIYPVSDDAGNPAIDIYCFNGETWALNLRVTEGTGNTSTTGCNVRIFALANGGYQFNITTDGKLYTLICTDLSCVTMELSYFDPNE